MFFQKIGLTLLFALFVWGFATAFFVLFGPIFLVDPDHERFLPVFLLLEMSTALLLYLVILCYTRIDRTPNAATKFGVWGAAAGLFLDTFSLWQHTLFFPTLSSGQLLSFAIWMVCAYAIYLILPLFVDHKKQTT
ncbi:YnzE [[Clostridium] ultunense Esp]|nr:YnzE [[Clostridium] ultunense Esp]